MRSKLRILMPSIYFPPRVGGIESHVFYLARELVRRGHRVTVITTRTERSSPRDEVMDGVRVRRLPSFGKHFLGWILSSVFSVPSIVSGARDHDIVHCHTFAFALGGSIASVLRGCPLVVTVHSSHFLRLAKKAAMRVLLRLVLRRSSVLLSTSKEIDGVVRGLLPGAETLPIVNGIDTETFRPVEAGIAKENGEFLIVCPRRLVEKNGVEFLIRALAHVAPEVNAKVYITGDGPLKGHLEDVAEEVGVRDRVVFMGSVENVRMPSIYSSADLVVIPSLVEATSIAALEAMACERVVAASRVGGLPEIIDDRVGVLTEPGSPESVARAIEKIAGTPDTTGMGREARKRVEQSWSIRSVTDIHEEIYIKQVGEV
ncbi:MAG: glycosyltransferase family 4 protein [Candidatus Eisenbacteria bacterium]